MLSKRRRGLLDEFETLEREMEEALDEAFHPMWDLKNRRLEPLAYMHETKDKVVITVDLPLVKKKDIKIDMADDLLEINATMQRCISFSKWGTAQKKCEFKSFYKAINLPASANTEKIKAKFQKGILTIEIPKTTTKYKIDIT